MRIIDSFELRSRPELVRELRAHPGEHVERRYAPMAAIEKRATSDAGWVLGGLAAVFDDLSVNLGGFRERIHRGAFRKVLATSPDVRCYINHNLDLLLGRTASGTLRLKEVPKGLDYETDAPAVSYADDLRVLIDRGDINQSSFAFRVEPGGEQWTEDPDTGALIRDIFEFQSLYDVSPVADPAYPTTTVGERGRDNTDEDQQRAAVANEQELAAPGEPSAQSDVQDQEPLQGEHLYVLAARQRQLRMRRRLAGLR